MELAYYCVKAFSNDPLYGNPAAIVLLEQPLENRTMQRIAAINGFPETVFLLKNTDPSIYSIWWFTPEREVFDAGHATLASQFLLFTELHKHDSIDELTFKWEKGSRLINRKFHNTLTYPGKSAIQSLDDIPECFQNTDEGKFYTAEQDLILVLDDEDKVRSFNPDLSLIAELPYRGLAVTSSDKTYHYCCRFFAPKYGVNEDFVTASVHNYLSLFWMSTNQIYQTTGIQYSSSPGIVDCTLEDECLLLSGDCCYYSKGQILI